MRLRLLAEVSVQDVHADEDTVWSAINDLPRYPKMIDGVVGCEVYSKKKEKGCDVRGEQPEGAFQRSVFPQPSIDIRKSWRIRLLVRRTSSSRWASLSSTT